MYASWVSVFSSLCRFSEGLWQWLIHYISSGGKVLSNATSYDFFRIFIFYSHSSFNLPPSFLHCLPSFLPYSFPIPPNLEQQWKISAVLRTTLFQSFVTHIRSTYKSCLMVATFLEQNILPFSFNTDKWSDPITHTHMYKYMCVCVTLDIHCPPSIYFDGIKNTKNYQDNRHKTVGV
jgi:hypothetical protein